MIKLSIKQGLLATAVAIVLAGSGFATANARAHVGEGHKATAIARLEENKLRICQKREDKINAIMQRIAGRGEKQIGVFNKIADRTKAFYVNKGKTLGNYDALVAEVDAKKLAAQAAVDAVRDHSVEFKCDGTDPKGAGASFKASQNSVKDALKAYKTAVKNLIVGVKSVQGSTTSTENNTEGGQQ